MIKNVASQLWTVFAFSQSTGIARPGDAANITGNLYIDGGGANAIDDIPPTEFGGGYYGFYLSATETNGDHICIQPISNTASVSVVGVPGSVWTRNPAVAQIGTNVCSISGVAEALVYDLPTVAEFNARTLVSADYVVTSDTLAAVTNVASVGGAFEVLINNLPTVTEFEARTLVSADYVVVGDTIAGVTSTANVASVGGAFEALLYARTLPSADYVVTSDTLAAVTNVASLGGVAEVLINNIPTMVWTDTGDIGLNYATMLGRSYQVLVNQLSVNNASGIGTLFKFDNTGTLATTELSDDSTTTLREKLTWI
jgi:hypothetical protein